MKGYTVFELMFTIMTLFGFVALGVIVYVAYHFIAMYW